MRPFIAYDKADSNGVRAEVKVHIGNGTVRSLEPSESNPNFVNVKIKSSNPQLKKPENTWTNIEIPFYELLQESLEKGKPISYVIEVQRKGQVKEGKEKVPVDRSLSISDLPIEQKTSILASVNGIVSREAVTKQSEWPDEANEEIAKYGIKSPDPSGATSGSALDVDAIVDSIQTLSQDDLTDPGLLNSLRALGLASGATMDQVYPNKEIASSEEAQPVRNAYAMETQPWKEHNTDGRLNLGSYNFSAGVGFYLLVGEILESTPDADKLSSEERLTVTSYYSDLLLAIADNVQWKIYGSKNMISRFANSYNRVKEILISLVKEQGYPLPFTTFEEKFIPTVENALAFAKLLSTTASDLYGNIRVSVTKPLNIVQVAQNPFETPAPTPPATPQTPATTPDSAPEPPVAPVESTPVETPAPEPTESVEPSPEVEPPAEVATESVDIPKEEAPELGWVNILDTNVVDPTIKNADQGSVLAFKELVENYEIPKELYPNLKHLLEKSFGPAFGKVEHIPTDDLYSFVDYYVAVGQDAMIDTLQRI